MTHVAVIGANLGGYEADWPAWCDQDLPDGVTVSFHRFTDATFTPRPLALTSRLASGILKMFGPDEIETAANVYLWIDASVSPTPICVRWFFGHLGDADMAVFKHPDRDSIREEVDFMLTRMARPGETYLNSRYKGERIAELYRDICDDASYADDRLFASTAFMYRETPAVRDMMADWWRTKSVYCLHDQIAWPWLIAKHGVRVNVIPDNYLKCPALTFTRTGQRRTA